MFDLNTVVVNANDLPIRKKRKLTQQMTMTSPCISLDKLDKYLEYVLAKIKNEAKKPHASSCHQSSSVMSTSGKSSSDILAQAKIEACRRSSYTGWPTGE